MLGGKADRRESCCLLELSRPNIEQLQFENEQKQTKKHTHVLVNKTLNQM